MSSEYHYDHPRSRQLNTNVIDHRPSLLMSTRQLMDRSPSPTSSRSQKMPMQEIYRSLIQNRPSMNTDKLIGKQRLKYLESLYRPATDTSNNVVKPAEKKCNNEAQSGILRKPKVKATPSVYRQKNCQGCPQKRNQFERILECVEINGNRPKTSQMHSSSPTGNKKFLYNFISEKPTWSFSRRNSTASSYTEGGTTSSLGHTEKSRLSSVTGTESDSISIPFEDLSTTRSITTARTDTASALTERRKKNVKIAKPKPDCLKNIFIVNGSIVSFNGHGFESFTNWFGDETMLRDLSVEGHPEALVHTELDMSGFTNQEINMKLYDGNKLVVEASRPLRGRFPAMRFKQTILLPKGLSVESLIVCRTKSGRLVIEDMPRPYACLK